MKISAKLWGIVISIWFLLRFILPIYIFINPVAGVAISLFLDSPDGYFSFRAKKSWKWYHKWDKLADYWWYILIVFYAYTANLPILGILIILFLYRSIGQMIALKKRESWALFFFPNILENYFIAYLLLDGSILTKLSSLYIWLICIVFAFTREYLIHIKKAYTANYIFHLGIDWSRNK